jgi:hypothetical protein
VLRIAVEGIGLEEHRKVAVEAGIDLGEHHTLAVEEDILHKVAGDL